MANKRMELSPEMLELVSGGAIGFNPDDNGTYTMICEFSGKRYSGVKLDQIMQIAKFGSNIPNTPEGEEKIVNWARGQGFIH